MKILTELILVQWTGNNFGAVMEVFGVPLHQGDVSSAFLTAGTSYPNTVPSVRQQFGNTSWSYEILAQEHQNFYLILEWPEREMILRHGMWACRVADFCFVATTEELESMRVL